MKVCTIVGTRPEVIKLSEVIRKLNNSEHIEHVLVHTCQNYDNTLNGIFFNDLELERPKHRLNLQELGDSLGSRLASLFFGVEKILQLEKPDAVLLLGDTYSCLSAIIAKNMKIPIFHMEAGNRCYDQNVPEEVNRKIVDHISDINLPYSTIAKSYLEKEDFPSDRVIKIGSPMREVLARSKEKILNHPTSDILSDLALKKKEYILCSIHRAENVDNEDTLRSIFSAISEIASKEGIGAIVSTHPRTFNRLRESGLYETYASASVKFVIPMSFSEYNYLQLNSRMVLSDSGTISEEASILGFKALNIRTCHERPEAMEEASVLLAGTKSEDIVRAYYATLNDTSTPSEEHCPQDYKADNVSEKVLKIILSYSHFVNRYVYRKEGV